MFIYQGSIHSDFRMTEREESKASVNFIRGDQIQMTRIWYLLEFFYWQILVFSHSDYDVKPLFGVHILSAFCEYDIWNNKVIPLCFNLFRYLLTIRNQLTLSISNKSPTKYNETYYTIQKSIGQRANNWIYEKNMNEWINCYSLLYHYTSIFPAFHRRVNNKNLSASLVKLCWHSDYQLSWNSLR